MTKGRDDVQVISLNVDDENPGLVEPFVSANHATVPVIVAGRPFVAGLMGGVSVPQTWLVDRNGTIRYVTRGFDDSVQDWARLMLERLEQLP